MRLAVLGSHVDSSLSPAMHQAALRHHGIGGDYLARRVDAAGFVAAISDLRSGNLDGANVTMPHKRRAFEACDVRSSAVIRAGAVNTLSRRGDLIAGDNTDIGGIAAVWAEKRFPPGSPVTVLGAGGAAAAALIALDGWKLRVVARDPHRAQRLVERLDTTAVVADWEESGEPSVLVNATPLGMLGESLPRHLLEPAIGLFDMAYGDQPTPAVVASQDRGLPVASGLDLLVAQAVLSFEIWTGVRPEPTVMRVAAEEELSRRGSQEGNQ